MSARVDMLWPRRGDDLRDEAVLAAYAPPASAPSWLRMNFVTSLDGAGTRDGRSGGLGGDADRRVFELLRRWADVVLVGAGTVRSEGYGGMRVDDDAAAWRTAHGFAAQPVLALVSARLDLDPASDVFATAPVRPIVYTVAGADPARREALAAVADVVAVGAADLDPAAVRADLVGRGLRRIHSEGGPGVFGSFLAAGVVDELCLTLAPTLEAGDAERIARSDRPAPTGMRLEGILRSADDELLLRYRRVS
ncbi:pyrimidine reductase family protein [Pseudolysinimonas sp.]|uniref:pyrimidine reductase family protein n=1 Tax=Pseudolysinimonas sp. TaxID=2680009 RepID=UPI003F7E0603